MKLFLVYREGHVYDEYDADSASVVGVYSTREKAEEAAKEMQSDIEEIELDQTIDLFL